MKKICFTIMPFGLGDEYDGKKEEADFIYYDIIRPSIREAVQEFKKQYGDRLEHELDVVRELENVAPGAVTAAIVRHIAESHITIVDLTGRNPNVFLELGIRFALRRNGTILLVQDIEQIPFNIRHYRVVEYKPRFGGIERAQRALQATILSTLEVLTQPTPPTTDSLVFDALPNLKVTGLGFTEESPASGRVSWDEYWARVVHIEEVLNELLAVGVYSPDIIVGISNGGLFLADTCLRLVYKNDVPFISLWAQRIKDKYFDNPINNALINKTLISELLPKRINNSSKVTATTKKPQHTPSLSDPDKTSRKVRVLIMDDIVGTQRTFKQLVMYFQDKLGDLFENVELRFVFLFTPRQETVESLRPYLLSQDPNIVRGYRPIELEAVTGKSDLPYRKSIHYGYTTQPPIPGKD